MRCAPQFDFFADFGRLVPQLRARSAPPETDAYVPMAPGPAAPPIRVHRSTILDRNRDG